MSRFVIIVFAMLLVSTLAPVSSASTTAMTGQFAYFYIPPLDGTTASNIASFNSYIILTHGNETYRNSLRQAGYTGSVYQYLLAAEVDGPGPYANSSAVCDSAYAPWHNQVAMDAGDFCKYIHPNESYFLHNSNGQRLYVINGSHINYQMNPAAPGWRTFFTQRALRELLGETGYPARGFDALFLDNLWVGLYNLKNQKANSTGALQEFATDVAYQNAMVGFLSGLKSALTTPTKTFPIAANFTSDQYLTTSWDAYLPYLTGGMNEAFAADWIGQSLPTVSEWLSELQKIERVNAQGKFFVAVTQGTQTDTTRMRLGYASYLLAMQPGKTFFRYADADSGYTNQWNYPEYAMDLGTPVGARFQQSDGTGTWRRNFTRGYVTVNPSTHTANIVVSNTLPARVFMMFIGK